jgi:diguanylate cyclase (GGDEF)-like protein
VNHQGTRLPENLNAALILTAVTAGAGLPYLVPLAVPWPLHLVATLLLGGVLAAVLIQGVSKTVDRGTQDALLDGMLDPVTRLGTTRLAELTLETELAAARRGRPLSIALVRIEDYPRFAKSHGRTLGENMLRTAARVVRRRTRAMHLAAHWGRDATTFIVILSGVHIGGACTYAKRLRGDITSITGFPEPVSVSMGVAAFEPDITAPLDLVARAERALERAAAGGGKIVVAGRRATPSG